MAAVEQQRRTAQDDAFRKIALKDNYLATTELDRALREQERQAERGTHLAIFQAVLRLRLLSVDQVKEILELVKQRYAFCPACGKENVRKADGPATCKHCQEALSGSSRRLAAVDAPADRAQDPWIGRALGGCQILDKLGEGGSGTVYRARQLALDRLVAIKMLYPWLALKDDHARRFLREAKAMARVEHPNVVPIYDYGSLDGTYYLVMSYQEGRNLGRHLADQGRLAVGAALDFAAQVLAGLRAMHRAGVIHRDLKPENIQITPDSRAMVMDFGLVRQMEGAESLTQSEQIVGTPFYMSPEQCLNRDVDLRTDIYSFGVTLYQMLAGVRPFGGNNAVELIMSHLYERAKPLDEVDPAIGSHVAGVVARMMAKDKRARYQTAQEALDDVDRLRAGKPPLAAQQARAEHGVRWTRAAVAVAAVLLALGAAYAVVDWRAGANDETDTATRPAEPAMPLDARAVLRLDEVQALEREVMALLGPDRTADEHRAGQVLLPIVVRRYAALAQDTELGHTRAGALALERYFAVLEVGRGLERGVLPRFAPVQPSPTEPDPATRVRLEHEVRHQHALAQIRAADLRFGRLLAHGQFGTARELIRLEPLPDAVAAYLRDRAAAQVDAAEGAVIASALDRAAGLVRDAKLPEALALLGALAPSSDALGRRVSDRIHAIGVQRDLARTALEEKAARLEQARQAELATRVVNALSAGDFALAHREAAGEAALTATAAGPIDPALRDAFHDLARCDGLRKAAADALERRRGQLVALRARDGAILRGVLKSVVPGALLLEAPGTAPRGIVLDELAHGQVLELAAGHTVLDWVVYCCYLGGIDDAEKAVERIAESPERDRLVRRVRARRLADLEATLERALSAQNVGTAYETLRALTANEGAADGRAEGWAALGRLAGEKHCFVARTRELFLTGRDALESPRWNLPPQLRPAADGWLLEVPGRGADFFEAFAATRVEYPFVIRSQLRAEGEGGRGGLAVGLPNAYVGIELAENRRWRMWERGSRGIVRHTPWRDLPEAGARSGSREDISITLDLVVFPRGIDVSVGGIALYHHPTDQLPVDGALVGMFGWPGTTIRHFRLTAHKLAPYRPKPP